MFGGFEVNFLPELKHLHDAGYNILTYDLRNHGLKGQGNGGISGLGQLECRDVAGSIRYVKNRADLKTMKVGIYSRCLRSISTVMTMARWPEEFTHIKAALFLNIVSARAFIEIGIIKDKSPVKAAYLYTYTAFKLISVFASFVKPVSQFFSSFNVCNSRLSTVLCPSNFA